MKFGVVTLFPGMFETFGQMGVTGRAETDGRIQILVSNPRDFVDDPHRTVDDRPYGGGPGMVLKYAPLRSALTALRNRLPEASPVIYLSPQGERFDDALARRFAGLPGLIFVCGRYEGVDERFVHACVDRELSIGDYVLSGGEPAAMVAIDAIARLLPGTLGDSQSHALDSFADGLLDCPHFTRPEAVGERTVPEVLLSGNHAAIAAWRQRQALRRTARRRPDLLNGRVLDERQRKVLDELESGVTASDDYD